VFLVKAFQRLVYRWRTANAGREPPASVLRDLLENWLLGLDVNPRAIHVASFSLYLAMCDEIDPRYYWSSVRFPTLRERRLRRCDFFREDTRGARTKEDAGSYDLVVGNAPWGKHSLTDPAKEWAKGYDWPTVGEQSGVLFLAKAARLCKRDGQIAMIQPSGALLFNIESTALQFRKKLFASFEVDEVINLSDLRFLEVFPKTVGPACIITMRPVPPTGDPIAYWSPKQTRTGESLYRIVIDEQDLNWVWPDEAADDPIVWPALMWGGRRHLDLARKLGDTHPTLSDAIRKQLVTVVPGFKRVPRGAHASKDRVGIPLLESSSLFERSPLVVRNSFFPSNEDPMFERERSLSSFRLPLLIVRSSWRASKEGRFKAILVEPTKQSRHLLFSQSYFGIGSSVDRQLAALAVVMNSATAVWYFYMTSGRLASYRPSLRKGDLERLPMPRPSDVSVDEVRTMVDQEIDAEASVLYGLGKAERALVEDFVGITLRDFKDARSAPGRQPAHSPQSSDSRYLEVYCQWFLDVVRAGFGQAKALCATIFHPEGAGTFPVCVIAIHLGWARAQLIQVESIADNELSQRLRKLDDDERSRDPRWEGVCYRRVSRIYQNALLRGREGQQRIPTVFMIKPNQLRYWTRSVAMRDADEVAADIMRWADTVVGASTGGLHDPEVNTSPETF
jgi:hypothetical protein